MSPSFLPPESIARIMLECNARIVRSSLQPCPHPAEAGDEGSELSFVSQMMVDMLPGLRESFILPAAFLEQLDDLPGIGINVNQMVKLVSANEGAQAIANSNNPTKIESLLDIISLHPNRTAHQSYFTSTESTMLLIIGKAPINRFNDVHNAENFDEMRHYAHLIGVKMTELGSGGREAEETAEEVLRLIGVGKLDFREEEVGLLVKS